MASSKVNNFVSQLAPAAIEIGAKYGLDPRLIISQSALETGWGDSVAGNNFFGVKSHGQPGGQVVSTHEEINGQMVPVNDSFRSYGSLRDSMEDYARFLRDNPRYSNVFNQQGVHNQIDAVAAAGYATDSQYANKLKNIAGMFELPGSPAMAYTEQPANSALNAINAAAPGSTPPANGGFWSGPLSALASISPGKVMNAAQTVASPQNAAQAAAAVLGTLDGRTALGRVMLAANTQHHKNYQNGMNGPFRGTNTGQTYTPGSVYQMMGERYAANPNGSFTNIATGGSLTGSSGSRPYNWASNFSTGDRSGGDKSMVTSGGGNVMLAKVLGLPVSSTPVQPVMRGPTKQTVMRRA